MDYISTLPPATLPLDFTEEKEIVQVGVNKRVDLETMLNGYRYTSGEIDAAADDFDSAVTAHIKWVSVGSLAALRIEPFGGASDGNRMRIIVPGISQIVADLSTNMRVSVPSEYTFRDNDNVVTGKAIVAWLAFSYDPDIMTIWFGINDDLSGWTPSGAKALLMPIDIIYMAR